MIEINFLPAEYLRNRMRRRINAICLALVVLVGVGITASFAVTEQQRHSLEVRSELIDREIDDVRKSLEQLEQVQVRRKQITAKAQAAGTLIDPLPQSLVLALTTNQLPNEVVLTGYDMKTIEVKRQSTRKKTKSRAKSKKKTKTADDEAAILPITRTTIELKGMARTDMQVAEFVANMNQSPLLASVNLRFCKEYDNDGVPMRAFKINVTLRNQLEVNAKDISEVRRMVRSNAVADGGVGLSLQQFFGVSK